jgi:hypothetical protein
VKRLLGVVFGALGLGALLRRRRAAVAPSPADDLREKLAAAKSAPSPAAASGSEPAAVPERAPLMEPQPVREDGSQHAAPAVAEPVSPADSAGVTPVSGTTPEGVTPAVAVSDEAESGAGETPGESDRRAEVHERARRALDELREP